MEVKSLREKFFAIQNEITNPKKTTEGYNYQYATLENVLEVIKPHLKKQRILLQQQPFDDGDKVGIKTMLLDMDSPQFFETSFASVPNKTDCQAIGSLHTYYRRYSLICIFGLTPIDDDGASTLSPSGEKKTVERKW